MHNHTNILTLTKEYMQYKRFLISLRIKTYFNAFVFILLEVEALELSMFESDQRLRTKCPTFLNLSLS